MSLPGQSIPAIPVMPLALFTDPGFGCDHRGGHDRDDHKKQEECWESRDKRSWEFQILARLGGDRFRFDRDDEGKHEVRRCKDDERGDGIPEMHVSLRSGQHAHDNGQIALVGVETAKEAIDQLITGMTYRQLLPRDGQLLLGQDEGASTPRNELQLPRRQLSDAELDYLGEQLRRIIGQPRVWMLYSHTLEGHKEDRKSDGALNVVGFVAARVLAVNLEKRDDRHGKHEHANLAVVLQPCMMITANAVTDYRRRDLGPRTLFNPYVCKVRLVE